MEVLIGYYYSYREVPFSASVAHVLPYMVKLKFEAVTNYRLEELHAGLSALTHRIDQVLCRSPKEW